LVSSLNTLLSDETIDVTKRAALRGRAGVSFRLMWRSLIYLTYPACRLT